MDINQVEQLRDKRFLVFQRLSKNVSHILSNLLPIQKIFLPLHPILAIESVKTAEIDKVKEPDKVKRYRFGGE